MQKRNLEKKIELALKELTDCFSISDKYPETAVDVMYFHVCTAISYLCMMDDWEVSERCTYYCLSEIERNLKNYVDERKRKNYENGYARIDRVGKE